MREQGSIKSGKNENKKEDEKSPLKEDGKRRNDKNEGREEVRINGHSRP